ncbi:MAG TPA: HNH endonuclease signature motif containing protein, partial [Pirellulaceae bacterium]|nr:HNH endonuclease signature motif containing protein [Pirellulaceae bacterium]
MTRRIPTRLRRLVRERAGGRCEYCLRHEDDSAVPHQPDHIISRKHGGATSDDNLAWACAVCNLLKGPETAAIDPLSGQAIRFFHPRVDHWMDHFRIDGGR